jgi:hypothetical protein
LNKVCAIAHPSRIASFLATTVLLAFASAAGAQPAPPKPGSPPADRLRRALLCEGEPLETVRSLATAREPGLTAKTTGEEEDETIVLTLQKEMVIEGARTNAVTMSFASPREDFLGLVFAEMTGDPAPLIKAFGLKKAARGAELPIGQYVKSVPGAEPNEVCPKTIALTPLGSGRFLFGCGWCNG